MVCSRSIPPESFAPKCFAAMGAKMKQGTAPEITLPRPGGSVFVVNELEHPDGGTPRRIAFSEVEIRPLGYEDLASAKLHQAITIPLEMYNGRIVETDVDGIDTSKYVHIRMTLESPFTARAIGLVRGGWLPSALAATRATAVILPDRNILSEISGRFEAGKAIRRNGSDFIDLFASNEVRINPLLAAMEGNGRAIPTSDAAQAQVEEAMRKLGRALPKAILMIGPDSIKGLLGLIEEGRPGLLRKQALLRHLAPMLSSPAARRDIDTRWQSILDAADAHRVPRASLVVLALLSALVHPTGSCAAKKIFKFHDRYSDGDAYNALSDIRALEVLLHLIALFPEMDTQLCTADRNLALFWTGAGISGLERSTEGIRFSLTPHSGILPDPYGSRWSADICPN